MASRRKGALNICFQSTPTCFFGLSKNITLFSFESNTILKFPPRPVTQL